MKEFIRKYDDRIHGVLSCFDLPDGTRHKHPHREGIARPIYYGQPGSTLVFNYWTEQNRVWYDSLKKHRYSTEFPDETRAGIVLDLQ